MTSREEVSQNRKQQILEAAASLFAESGYYKTTTAEVARRVGVTQPYVFHFFKTKEELYLAVLDQASRRILDAFTTAEAPPEQLTEAMGEAFTRLLVSHRNEILLVLTSFAAPEPTIREYTREGFDAVYERIKARFEEAGLPEPSRKASEFLGQGMVIALAETLQLPKLLIWHENKTHG
ncbi:TetR/AcrR family transcriptional regulator [Paenibacillus aurantiacus]|uniref:TetR/AcrR family transcriptional regulator n=1 Tax=Paenibacillus aurantiacus TaxID=1936118 RepID=A0ABV5KIS6_9BACL